MFHHKLTSVPLLLVIFTLNYNIISTLSITTETCGTNQYNIHLKRTNINTSLPNTNSIITQSCKTEGRCDDPKVRDAMNITEIIHIRSIFQVFNANNGSHPNAISKQDVEEAQFAIRQFYLSYNILLSFEPTIFHNASDEYYCVPNSGENFNNTKALFATIDQLKLQYAHKPSSTLNIYVTCQQPGPPMHGFATFAWNKESTSRLGGLWLNSLVLTSSYRKSNSIHNIAHELGHCFGLWHTQHGVNEVCKGNEKCCSCTENFHSITDYAANYVGDFCSDTPATPLNKQCHPPLVATDCNNHGYGSTDYKNIMGYAEGNCADHFTVQQNLRMFCWICDRLQPFLLNKSACHQL